MSNLAIKTTTLSRTDWLKARQSGIGGSDISAIMGFNPYKTAYDLYLEKTGEVSEEEMSEPAYWGTILEDVVAKEYAKRNNVKVQKVNFMLRHPQYPFAVANIDRAVINPEISGNVRLREDCTLTTDKLLEVKTASEYVKNNWGDEDTDQVPDNYNLQVQWYMGITGVHHCDLALLIGGNKYRQYAVKFDPDLFAVMIDEAKNFWENHVLAGIAPEAVTLANAKHKYAKADPATTLNLSVDDDDSIAVIDQYILLKDQAKQVNEDIESVQASLINIIGYNETLAVEGEIVLTYKAQKGRESFDKKGCLKHYPELAEKFAEFTTVGEPCRVMRVK